MFCGTSGIGNNSFTMPRESGRNSARKALEKPASAARRRSP